LIKYGRKGIFAKAWPFSVDQTNRGRQQGKFSISLTLDYELINLNMTNESL